MNLQDVLAPGLRGAGPAAAPASSASAAPDARLRQTAEEFEAVFLAQVLQTMQTGIGGPGPMTEGDNEAWSGMLQEEYGRLIAKSGGIGVADALMREMLKLQEVA